MEWCSKAIKLKAPHILSKRPKFSCMKGNASAHFVWQGAVVVSALIEKKQPTHLRDCMSIRSTYRCSIGTYGLLCGPT